MPRRRLISVFRAALASGVFAVGVSGIWIAGCATDEPRRRGGAETWSSTCGRCHDTRSPSTFSDSEWDIVVHHMRVRGYLLPEEQEIISEFLKRAN